MLTITPKTYTPNKLKLWLQTLLGWGSEKKIEQLTQQNTDLKLRLAKAEQSLAAQQTENLTLKAQIAQAEKNLSLQKLENRVLLQKFKPVEQHYAAQDHDGAKAIQCSSGNLFKPSTPADCLDHEQRIKQLRLNQQIYA